MKALAWLRRPGRWLWRGLLWTLLLMVLVSLPLLALLGSETGSRWVVERALGMQRALRVEVRSGNLLTGLELAELRLETRKVDLHIRHLLARWSLVQLLRGEVVVEHLEADGVTLKLVGPPSAEPVRLPRLVLPLALQVETLILRRGVIEKGKSRWALDRIELAGRWAGPNLRLERLNAEDARLGRLGLAGELRFWGDWPLQGTGWVAPRVTDEQGWAPIHFRLDNSLADLDVDARSSGALTARLQGRVKSLLPDLPFEADLSWSDLSLPWWPALALQSREGRLRAIGDRKGVRSLGDLQLQSRPAPAGRYQWRLRTDWRSADVESFKFNGLGGEVNASGKVAWGPETRWTVTADLRSVDLGQHWPMPPALLPVLTGKLDSTGRLAPSGSEVGLELALVGGERWRLQEQATGLPWRPASRHTLALDWQQVQRQLPAMGGVTSSAGSLALEGHWQQYRLSGQLGLAGERLPAGDWQLELAGAERQLVVDRLRYQGEAGELQAGGELDFRQGLRWQGALSLAGFATGWWLPEWSGQLSGTVSGRGSLDGARRELQLDDVALTGQLREQPFRLDGALALALDGQRPLPRASSPGLALAWGENRVTLAGELAEAWDGRLQLGLAQPGLVLPGAAGRLEGTLNLVGPAERPDLLVDLQGEALALAGTEAATARLQGRLAALGDADSRIELVLGELVVRGRDLGNLGLQLSGQRQRHALGWTLTGAGVTSDGRLAGGMAGAVNDWSGQLAEARLAYAGLDWQLAESMAMDWRQAERQLGLAAHCWVSGDARFCAPEPLALGREGRAAWRLDGLRLERLAGLLPEGLRWQGPVAGQVDVAWRPGQPLAASAGLQLGAGALGLERDEGAPLMLAYQSLSLSAQALPEGVALQLALASDELGRGRADLHLDPYAEGLPLRGDVDLTGLRLEVLQPFFPELSQLSGRFGVNGRLDGVLRAPRFFGELAIADGRLALRRLPLQAEDIGLRVAVTGDAAQIEGELRSGPGTATLTGAANWQEAPSLELALRGQRFELRQEPQLLAEVSPDLRLRMVPRQIELRGSVRVPMARINLKSLPERAVGLSPDVRVLDSSDRRVQLVARGQPWQVSTDIELMLGDDVSFEGFGLTSKLGGGLRLRQSGQRGLEAAGEVELDKEARYQAYGQNLRIRRGQLVFAGSVTQPGLDIEAIREVDDVVVGIRVLGRANAPEATLFSEPSMAQEEALSYLVLGRPLVAANAEGSDNNLVLAAAAIKLGARGGAGLTSGIGNVLGIQDLSLDAEGSGDDTQVKVSGYLSPSLYLSYGVGVFTPVNTITLRYQIRPRLYLEALSSLENAIDLFYNLRF